MVRGLDTKRLLEALKAEALPAVWSQGVKLAREKTVLLESENQETIVLRVRSPGQVAYSSPVLYPEDLEWTCDCGAPTDPCRHVVAAAIAVRQSAEGGEPLLRAAETGTRLEYAFRRLKAHQMTLERYVVAGDRRLLLEGTLAGAQSKHAIHPGPGDLVADRITIAAERGILTPSVVPALFEALRDARVTLDDSAIKVDPEPVFPRARVFDDGRDVVLEVTRSPEVTEVVTFGIALCAGTLRPLGLTELTGLRLERLPLTRRCAPDAVAELASRVLPELEAKMTVAVETRRLPRVERERVPPRIVFDLEHGEHTLSVLPLVVYGDPPRARVDAGRLVLLQGSVPARDEAAERALLARLRDELNLVAGRRVHFDGQEASRFASKLRAFQSSLGAADSFGETPLEPHLVVDGDSLHLEFRLATSGGGDERPENAPESRASGVASAEAVLRAWRDGLSLVSLQGSGWAPLPESWLSKYGDRIADLLAARDAKGRVARAAIPALAALCDELEQPRPPSFAALEPLIRGFEQIPEAPRPADLTATLRPYQQRGADWLCFLRDAGLGAVLADDMGLGKTLQTLCAIRAPALVVCPKSVVHNWEAETRRFRPMLRTALYQGPNRELDDSADVTITTYSILRLDVERLAARRWSTIVLDEAQAIKNPDSQVARAAYRLETDFPVALSGTPLENRMEELWSLLHFTHRGLLAGRAEFRERYGVPIEQGVTARLAELRSKTKPFLLRRLKRDVAPELPPRTDMVLEVDLEPAERELYGAVHATTRREVVERLEQGGNVMRALEALLRLRQAACHPALVPGQQATTSSKIEALLESLEPIVAEGHKALVFSQWTTLLDLTEPHLAAAGMRHMRLDGSTRNRAEVVGEFQSDTGPPILLTSLKAGGTGLNLTAADHVFLLDPWWNPAAEDQAADRAHRIGQDRPVMVYRLIAKDTVEEKILSLQAKKRFLAEAALEGTGNVSGITRDDLLALLA